MSTAHLIDGPLDGEAFKLEFLGRALHFPQGSLRIGGMHLAYPDVSGGEYVLEVHPPVDIDSDERIYRWKPAP